MGNKDFYLVLCAVLVIILTGCIVLLVKSYKKLVNRNETLRESFENLVRLNDRLRMDRHDYLNHLQVIYGLMELKEYDEKLAEIRSDEELEKGHSRLY